MESKIIPELKFDENRITYLLENADKLPLVMSKDQIDRLISTLREDLLKIEDTIKKLQELENDRSI